MHDEQKTEKSYKSNYSASVVSGGALLHSVRWSKRLKFSTLKIIMNTPQ